QYTFYLREDVRWQDGKPLTADDVIYTYETIQNPKVDAASLRNYYRDVLKAEKLGPHAVRFTYRNPYAGALYTLGLMMVLPKHIFDDGRDFNIHPANRKPVGSGPYVFEEWKTGQRIVLKHHNKYWRESYHFKKLIFKIVPSGETAFQLFKKGDIDLIDISPLQWARQTESEKFTRKFVKHQYFTPFSAYNYIGWNEKRPIFQDKRVRLALAHLVDRTTINEKLLFGLYMPITGPYYPLGANYDKSLPPIDYNLEKAKQLLNEAEWIDHDGDGIRDKKGVPLRFTMLFSTGVQFYEQLTPILQQNFARAGIELDLRRLEAVTLFRLLGEHDFDCYVAGWGRGAGIEDLYQTFHSSQAAGGSNFVSYANPQVDRLLEEGRREFDSKKRSVIYQQVHRLLYEDQPYLFMFARPELLARDKRFKNVKEYPIGVDMREWRVEE
ncbi:MAG: peptide-binding protein, partial [bacterium]|nr:peptide-binding protein [bacterium]